MDTISMLLHGLSVCMEWGNLLACAGGVILGTLVGVLPGIGTVGAIALLLPFSYGMDTTSSLIMFTGIYFGSKYGGSTTSVLMNLPGETSSVVTCLDGYAMAQKGRAGAALAISAIGSFVAGTFGIIGLMVFAPPLAQVAIEFGPPEYLALALTGLMILTKFTCNSIGKAILMIAIGSAVGTVGLDSLSGASRFTFGSLELDRGIDLSLLAMGIFGIGELLTVMTSYREPVKIPKIRLRDLYPNKEERRRSTMPIVRGSVLGFIVGLLPGASATISTFLSYALEKKVSRNPKEFGHGAIEGVAGPESANNSSVLATMIPLLSLGLPFCGATAILLSGFMIHGVTPGPTLITEYPDLFWGLIASMYVGNFMLLLVNLPAVGLFVQLLKTPMSILMPIVIVLTLTGTYAINNSAFDIIIVLICGLIGFFLNRAGYEPTPLIIGIVLGPEIEQRVIQSLVICDGNIWTIVSRPISAPLFIICGLVCLYMIVSFIRQKNNKRKKIYSFDD